MPITLFSTVRSIGVSKKRMEYVVDLVLDTIHESAREVSIHCVGEMRMQTRNRETRGIDKPTDVLSYPIAVGDEPFQTIDGGDIFLCPSYIRRQAARFSVSYREEFQRMLIHGTLHLFGYDHVKKKQAADMFRLQETLVEECIHLT